MRENKLNRNNSTRINGSVTGECTKKNVVCLQQKAKKSKRVPSKKFKRLLTKIGVFALGFMCVAPITFIGSFVYKFVNNAEATMTTLSHMILLSVVLGSCFGLILQKAIVGAR